MRALIIYLLMICTSTLCAQTSAGTRFWCAFMENLNIAFNDAPVFRFEIETTDAATGVIQVPTTGLEIPFDIPANSIETVTLPDLIFYTIGTEVVDNKGLLITSDVPIRVSAFHNRAYFSESALLLPEPNLGQEYIVTCYKDDNDFSPTAFVVLATADNTTIEITPSVNTLGLRPANLPFTVELQAGENYQVKANEDLTGTRIQSLSGEPIAVFSGAQQANVELCSGADNHLYEQSLPLNDWADLYYFVPLQGQGGDIIKVVAATDNTLVFFDCAQVATLNAGESYTEKRLAATVITATAPIAVSQFNTSQSCNPSGIGDPNMLRLIPPNLQVDRVRFASPNTTSGLGFNYFTEHYVTVITATENINTIQLDGGGIALSFDPFPSDPDYSYAQVEVNPGKHLLSSTASFSAYSYGFGDFDAYSTHAGYGTTAEVNFACLDIQVEGLFCVDSLLQFTANANLPITTWDWSFGDGGVATAAAPSYSYTDVGTYVVNLSVVFEDGSTAETSLELTISDCPTDPCILPQQLTIVPPNNLCLGTALDFSFDADFEAIAQSWFLDGELVGTAPTYGSFFNTPGTFELKLIAVDAFNCSREATFSIEIENCGICFQAGEQDLTFEGALCLDSTLTFFLPFDPFFYPPAELGWVFNGEFVIDFDPSVTLTQTGEFIVEFFAVDIFGCTYFGALELTVENCGSNDPCDPLPPFSITSSGTFCTNEPLAFGTNTSATIVTYSWTATNGQASTNAIFNPSFDTEGVYEVALTAVDINGCVYSDAQAFDISTCNDPCDPLPIIGINTNAIPSCVGEPLFFTPETTADLVSFNWIASNGATSTTSLFETTFNTAGDQLVELTATDSDGCTYETNIPFFVDECTDPCDPPADLAININGPFCVDSTLLFSASSPATLTSYDWQFSTGEMATSANPTFTPSDSAELTIQLEATDTNGCLLMADTTILIDACAPPPVCDATISIIPPDSLCAGDPLLFAIANNTPLSQQTWTVDGINSFSGPSLSLLVELGELDVELEVIAENGCIYTDQINLNINELCTPPELCRLGIPNAFSPNQDSFNDTFEPVYKCPPLSYELQVYDRWGNQVFVSELPELGWDGTFNGQAMDPGIYVWFVRYQLQDGREVVDKGDVLLMR